MSFMGLTEADFKYTCPLNHECHMWDDPKRERTGCCFDTIKEEIIIQVRNEKCPVLGREIVAAIKEKYGV